MSELWSSKTRVNFVTTGGHISGDWSLSCGGVPFNGICFSQNDHSKGKKLDKEFLTLKQDVQRKTAVYFFLRLFYFIGLFVFFALVVGSNG